MPEESRGTPEPCGADTPEQRAHFYGDAGELTRQVTQFLADGLLQVDSALVIASAQQRESICAGLAHAGVDVAAGTRAGRLTLLDAEEMLAAVLRGGTPDPELFADVVGKRLAGAATALVPPARLRVYDEMVDVLWSAGQRSAALQLEELWAELERSPPVALRCVHTRAGFLIRPAERQGERGKRSRALAALHEAEGEDRSQVRPVAEVYEHARQLEREIAQRIEVERSLRESLRELRAEQERLRRSEEQLRDFVDNASIGLHSVGPDGTILWANRMELELLGYDARDYVGRPVADFHVDADVSADILARLRRGEALHNYEARLRAYDGSIKNVLISSSVYTREGRFIHTRCFTRDITERRKAQRELEESHRQLQLITDALPVLVALIDAERRYQFASAGYERWFGRARAEVVGRSMEEVLGAAAYQAIRQHVSRALAGETVTYEAQVPYRAGGARWIHASYLPQRDAAGIVTGFVALVSDITEKKEFERFRAQAAARAERLLTVTAAIAGAVGADEVFEALVERVADAVGASSAALWLADHDQQLARLMRARGYSPAARQQLEALPLGNPGTVPAVDCMQRGEPIWISSQQELFQWYPHLTTVATAGRGYRIACLPLIANQQALGSLALTIEQGEGGPEEQEFLLLVSRYASQALVRLHLLQAERKSRDVADAAAARLGVAAAENSRLYQESLESKKQAEQLYRFAQSVVSAERVEQVFDAALAAIQVSLGAERSAILLRDGEGVMRFRAWRELSEHYRSAVEGHSPWPADATDPQPLLVPDVEQAEGLAGYLPLFRRERIGALAFFPLINSGRLLGKFMVYHASPHAFVVSDVATARAIANHLASVVVRFSVIDELEETVRYNELFAGILAHDLRNPLGAIITAAQLLLMHREGEGAKTEREAKPLSRILASGQRMTAMIEQLLDFTRARSGGGIMVESRPTNLAELCAQAIGEIELTHPERRIEQTSTGDPNGTWDAGRLLQVLSNLLANACQHGVPHTPVVVGIDGSDQRQVTVEVHNQGAIPAAMLGELFDPFRSTRHQRQRSRGLGLGLFIVREIVRAHGGTVTVSSTELDGTTFAIQLPRG